MSKQLDELQNELNKQIKLLNAAELVLNDFKARRESIQAGWDQQEKVLQDHVTFYEGWVSHYQTKWRELDQVESQRNREKVEAVVKVVESFSDLAQAIAANAKPNGTVQRGAVTKEIETTLRYAEASLSISKLADRLLSTGLKSDRDDATSAVRSALKNLKKQGKVRPAGLGEYVHNKPQKQVAPA